MVHPYIDLHTHTVRSDGCLQPMELVRRAWEAGIGTLAITDHNYATDPAPLRQAFPGMRLIQGSEISCLYQGRQELHVVALGFDPNHPAMQEVFRRNRPDRRPYIEAILAALKKCGIRLGSYDELRALSAETFHFGRMQLARIMVDRGICATVDEAFDEYLGAHGKRRAYVPNPLEYVPLEQAVEAILAAGGVPVLAHLYYYRLTDAENHALLAHFAGLTKGKGAMEVHYGRYTPGQRQALAALAAQYGLMVSCASDYHGQNEAETLSHGFDAALCAPLLALTGMGEGGEKANEGTVSGF